MRFSFRRAFSPTRAEAMPATMWIALALVLTAAAQAPGWTLSFETRCSPGATAVAGCTADWRPATAACLGEQLRIRVRGPEAWVCATDASQTLWPPDGKYQADYDVTPSRDLLLLDGKAKVEGAPGGEVVFHVSIFLPQHDKSAGGGNCPYTGQPIQRTELKMPQVDCPVSR